MRKIIFAFAFVNLLAQVASAQELSEGKISEIRVQSDRILVSQQNATNPDGCSNTDYLYLPQSEEIHKNMYATLLTARSSGQSVRLKLKGNGCSSNYPVISEVWLYQ